MIADLRDHPRFLPQLVDAFFAEWPQWCARAGRADVASRFVAADPLPAILVAFEGDSLLGTVALRPYFAEEPMARTPWVRQLLVLPAHRGRGIDRELIGAVEGRARELGYRHVHAATHSIERLLVRRGWEVFDRVDNAGETLAWLRKALA